MKTDCANFDAFFQEPTVYLWNTRFSEIGKNRLFTEQTWQFRDFANFANFANFLKFLSSTKNFLQIFVKFWPNFDPIFAHFPVRRPRFYPQIFPKFSQISKIPEFSKILTPAKIFPEISITISCIRTGIWNFLGCKFGENLTKFGIFWPDRNSGKSAPDSPPALRSYRAYHGIFWGNFLPNFRDFFWKFPEIFQKFPEISGNFPEKSEKNTPKFPIKINGNELDEWNFWRVHQEIFPRNFRNFYRISGNFPEISGNFRKNLGKISLNFP